MFKKKKKGSHQNNWENIAETFYQKYLEKLNFINYYVMTAETQNTYKLQVGLLSVTWNVSLDQQGNYVHIVAICLFFFSFKREEREKNQF